MSTQFTATSDDFTPTHASSWGTTDAGWAWTDVSSGVFTPDRKVRIIVGDVDYGVFTVVSWEHGLRLVNEKRQRLVRCAKLHAAYRRRRA